MRGIGSIARRLSFSEAALERTIEHLADALGEEKTSERTRHVWNVGPPPGRGFRRFALEHGKSVQDANGETGLAPGAPSENGEPPSKRAPRPAQDAEHAARPSCRGALRERQFEADPLLADPRRRLPRRDNDDADAPCSKAHADRACASSALFTGSISSLSSRSGDVGMG